MIQGEKLTNVIEIFYDNEYGNILKLNKETLIAETGELDGIYIPQRVIAKYKTPFFQIEEKEGKILLIPVKLSLSIEPNNTPNQDDSVSSIVIHTGEKE